MPSLNDMLAKNRLPTPSGVAREIKGQATQAFKSTRDEIKNIPAGIAAAQTQMIRNGAASVVNSGLSAVREAAQKAMTGDFTGALSRIEAGPSDVMGTLSSVFGLSSGGSIGGGAGAESTNTLRGALERADPMLSFDWYCDLPVVTPLNGQPYSLGWNYVEEASTPFRQWESRSVFAQGRDRHYASKYSLDGLRLTFYASVDGAALRYLDAWQRTLLPGGGDPADATAGGMGRPGGTYGYKKPIDIYLVAPDKQLVARLSYIECWPIGLDALALDSASSNRLTFQVNFSAGDVRIQLFRLNDNNPGASLLSSLTSGAVDGALSLAKSAAKGLKNISNLFG